MRRTQRAGRFWIARYRDQMARSFDDLVAEAEAADVSGWDFAWLEGRASEQRPSWGYQRLLGERLSAASSALDIQTGGGEVLSGVPTFPPTAVATESWPPNVLLATQRLHPRGVVVVADPDEPPLPFADGAFDLVSSRHPATVWWSEIARVLQPAGTYFAQHVGPDSNIELYEFFLGAGQADTSIRHPDNEAAQAIAVGLDITDLRCERLRLEFRDIGAVVYFLRKVIWTVPDFSVERYRERLQELDRLIRIRGAFVSHSSRTLIEAQKQV
jgi:SAM-dependent methyltransferase